MAEPSLEGLRQAFVDPESRIRLLNDPPPLIRTQIESISWEGGFLDGMTVRFNQSLNVLIGGRGCGKSTIIESLRFALSILPIGEDAIANHKKTILSVLQSGTRVVVNIRTSVPNEKFFSIERTVGASSLVRDDVGSLLNILPRDAFPDIAIFGQHEIAEITKSAEHLTSILSRIASLPRELSDERRARLAALQENRLRLLESSEQTKRLSERLESLPALELDIARYEAAGFATLLARRSNVESERRISDQAQAKTANLEASIRAVETQMPIDVGFANATALASLNSPPGLDRISPIFERLSADLIDIFGTAKRRLADAGRELEEANSIWKLHAAAVETDYEQKLRILQTETKSNEGERYITLRRQVESLRPLAVAKLEADEQMTRLQSSRRELVAEWDDVQRRTFRLLDKAAKQLNTLLAKRLRVSVIFGADRSAIHRLLDQLSGRFKECHTAIDTPAFSLRAFCEAVHTSKANLVELLNIPEAQASRLFEADLAFKSSLEEIESSHSTSLQLNVGTNDSFEWREITDLSTGQKATAVLLLLMASDDAPLVIDQPEDDLDNQFISDSVVPGIRSAKKQRQFIFATHNANLPVLGDAELIIGLKAVGDASGGHGIIPMESRGSIDTAEVKELVGRILEGGKEAFLLRREKYGY